MAERRAKTAVIGVGLIGEQHAEAYQSNPRAELTMVCDLSADRAKSVGERLAVASTANLADIANSDVEIVSVATPDHAHYESVMAMLEAGKHVVVEKPIATITREAKAMVELAEAKNLKMTVNLGNRWNPNYLSIRDSVQSGEIGEPVMTYSKTSDTIWVPRTMLSWAGKSGPQWFLFAHTMDMVRWILGQEAIEVYAIGQKKILKSEGIDAFDAIQALVRFENSFATFETSWIVPEAYPHIVESQLTINGSTGRLNFEGATQGFQITSDTVGKHMYARPSLWTYFKLSPSWWGALHNMVDCVLDGGEPAIAARDGMQVTAMIEAAEISIAEGRSVEIASLLN
ncbi:MAG: Gfo/Idh/MocA family oxidoreductase [Thermomicrobiales bacterium]|nr:Gfo/Idh/MocA family oxidoreductase [Thermomicrobiales bacterium]